MATVLTQKITTIIVTVAELVDCYAMARMGVSLDGKDVVVRVRDRQNDLKHTWDITEDTLVVTAVADSANVGIE